MPSSVERDGSVESDRYLKHQHSSSSDTGRALVPMWDSSDPERAPPPLPMNPSSPVVVSRPNTSTAIKSAHAALTEKARESAYMINPPLRNPEHSPERSLIKGAAHKRMQSLHTGSVRDMSNFLEGGSTFGSTRSPERSPTRQSSSPRISRELEIPYSLEKIERPYSPEKFERPYSPEKVERPYSPEKFERIERDTVSRSATPTPTGRDTPIREMANVRPSLRRPQQSILGENGPPQSATMLALQNISTRDVDTSLSDVTNGSTALVRAPQTLDALSVQILGITNIATSLQREMANLARRSKDNATDLVSLKEATNARDEDIRKSLRELVNNLSETTSRSSSSNVYDRGLFLDSKAHTHTPPPNARTKAFTLPRIPSPKSFASSLDRESMISPASFMHDGGATIALLEKILRDMGTREGQEHLVGRLTEVAETLSRDGLSTATKLDELLQFVKKNSEPQVVVTQNIGGEGGSKTREFSFDEPPRLELEFDPPRQGPLTQRVNALLAAGGGKENIRELNGSRGSDVITEDILKIIRNVKDSVAQGGGLTAEVKALVRELRGEVLGMGREIGRKLDESNKAQDLSAEDAKAGTENVARIVQDGLDELKHQMDDIVRENRRQSSASSASRTAVDYQEIYNAVRTAINEKDQNDDVQPLEKEDIIEAVKEAWENYKSDIEIQQFGLERDELLACLKEGIQQYAPQDNSRDLGATREEVFTAVVEGLKHFSPPKVDTEASLSREEILDAVRECLEEFEFPSAPPQEPLGPELTRDDMLGAVREGLHTFDFNVNTPAAPPANDDAVTRDEILDAITEGIQSIDFSSVIPANRELDDGLTRDDVLDALKEGLESFDFAANAVNTTALSRGIDNDAITRHDVLEAVREGLESFNFPVPAASSRDLDDGLTRHDVLDALKEGLECFKFPVSAATSRDIDDSLTRQEILDALKEGLQSFDFTTNAANSTALSIGIDPALNRNDVYDAVKAGLRDTPIASGADFQLALRKGLESFEFPVNNTALSREFDDSLTREDVLDALKEGLQSFDFASNAANTTALSLGTEPGLSRDDVYDAVQASLKDTPLISGADFQHALQQGLESFDFPVNPSASRDLEESLTREDVLFAVKEGLQSFDFATNAANTTALSMSVEPGLNRDDVYDAVQASLKDTPLVSGADFQHALREGLESFDFPVNAPASRDLDESLTREDVLNAVKEGLQSFDFAANAANTTTLSMAVEPSLNRDDVFDAVKAGLRDSPTGEVFNQQVVDRLHEILESIQIEFRAVSDEAKQNVAAHGRDTEQLLDATKDGFERLRADIESYVDTAANVAAKDELLEMVRDNFDTIRTEIELLLSKGSDSSLEAVQGELEHLRETMATSLVRGGSSAYDKEEIMEAFKEGVESLRADIEKPRAGNAHEKEEIIEAFKIGVESLRADIDRPRDNAYEKEEIIEAFKEGVESLRADIERPRDGNESILSSTSEILDALNDGLNSLRIEVERIGNKPVDMTVNYEILDTLKLGMESLRADIDRLRDDGYSDRRVAEVNEGAIIAATDGLKRNDIENLEVLITQLRIKVEAFEAVPPPPPPMPEANPDALSREHLAPVEEALRNMQESIAGMSNQEREVNEDGVTRADFEAIETLLHNTKAKIDEMDPSQAANKEQLDLVEALILEAKEGLSGLASHLDDVVKKDDVNVVEALVRDIATSLEAMREAAIVDEDDSEKVTKIDVEAVEAVCLDIKVAIDQMLSTDIALLASKDDVKVLSDLVQEIKNQVDVHVEVNAKSFEERQAETVGVGERVSEIKIFLEEFKDAMKEKLDEGSTSVEALGKFLESLGETITQNATLTDDIKTLAEAMNNEFEKSNACVVGSKLDNDEKFQKTWDTLDGIGAKSDGIDLKLEEKFNDFMTKYDEAQTAAEARAAVGEEKSLEIEAGVLGTKAVAEELKSFIATLGTTLTESTDKIDESSKTVFSRVDETFARVDETFSRADETFTRVDETFTRVNETFTRADETFTRVNETFTRADETFTRVEETHADAKAEHQLTREQVFKTLGAIEGVQGHVTEYNPKILESIKDVLLIVGQHYEHSKSSNNTLQEIFENIPPPAPVIDLPLLLQAAAPEKYDDAQVHQKLDKLVDHTHAAGKSFAQLDMLDKIHQQVLKTAAEVSDFVSAQSQRISDDHEDKEKAVEAATIALEKRLSQKEAVEAIVVGLREEEELLRESVAMLKGEQESYAHQKMRLCADVSSLETALRIRREELQAMEARAEGLERRILEGVIDHSRALLISKQNKGREAMSRKRVPSHATSTTGSIASSVTSRASYHTQSAVSMAMGGNRSIPTVPINTTSTLPAARRILSLNQITNNVPTGNSAFLSRSHSVKTPQAGKNGLRKSSWGGSLSRKPNHYGDLNKENLALKEMEGEDEGLGSHGEVVLHDGLSVGGEDRDVDVDMDEDRRESGGTTIFTTTETELDGDGGDGDEGTEWTGSYDSGDEDGYSEVTETETSLSRREEEEEEDEDVHHQPLVLFQEAV